MNWSARTLVNANGDSTFPQIDTGPTSGDFRLAWQDDRTGQLNAWYVRSADGGTTWGPPVRLSNLGSGAPYKSPGTTPDGDYFGMAVSSTGIAHVIWGEAARIVALLLRRRLVHEGVLIPRCRKRIQQRAYAKRTRTGAPPVGMMMCPSPRC